MLGRQQQHSATLILRLTYRTIRAQGSVFVLGDNIITVSLTLIRATPTRFVFKPAL